MVKMDEVDPTVVAGALALASFQETPLPANVA
jgi:hypothetical protein